MNGVITDIRKIKSAYSHDVKLMLQKVKEKLQDYTEGSNDVNTENLGINNSLGNEVLDVLRISRNSQNINSDDLFEILELLGKLPMFPDVRNKINDFKISLQSKKVEHEKLDLKTHQGQQSELTKTKVKRDYKKLLVLLLALLFILFTIGIIVYYINRPIEKFIFYKDADSDGYGITIDSVFAENAPSGYVSNHDDTDDTKPCIPDSTTQACIKIKDPINPPSQTNSTENGTTVPDAGTTTGPGNFNCPTLSKNIGDACSDGDPNTVDDKVNSSCICVGKSGPPPPKDGDGDGLDDQKDACPTRKGSTSNFGCPKVNLNGTRSLNVGERTKLRIEYDDTRPNDQINWSSQNDLVFSSKIGKEVEISSNIVGKYRINYKIYNSKDEFVMENSDIFHVKVSNKTLEKELMNLAEYGNNKILKIKDIEDKKAESELLLKKWIDGNIPVSKSGGASKPKYNDFINELLSVKRSSETHIRSITISDISYEENSGKINFFKYKLN
jgi:hypothetical protein